MSSPRPQDKQKSHLQTIRFGDFLCEQQLLSEDQLLASLADCWSNGGRIGEAIARQGFLPVEEIESQARVYHGLQVVEVGAPGAASAPGPGSAVPSGPPATGADSANAPAEGL